MMNGSLEMTSPYLPVSYTDDESNLLAEEEGREEGGILSSPTSPPRSPSPPSISEEDDGNINTCHSSCNYSSFSYSGSGSSCGSSYLSTTPYYQIPTPLSSQADSNLDNQTITCPLTPHPRGMWCDQSCTSILSRHAIAKSKSNRNQARRGRASSLTSTGEVDEAQGEDEEERRSVKRRELKSTFHERCVVMEWKRCEWMEQGRRRERRESALRRWRGRVLSGVKVGGWEMSKVEMRSPLGL